MRKRAMERAAAMQLGDTIKLSFIAEMRFVGQAFEVPVELSPESLAAMNF